MTRKIFRIFNWIVSNNRSSNAAEIPKEYKASRVAASRSITFHRLQEVGYRSRVPVCKPQLVKEYAGWAAEERLNVLFSDDSKFASHLGTKAAEFWRKTGEQCKPSCTRLSVNFPQSVMAWGVMSAVVVGRSMPAYTRKFWSISCFHQVISRLVTKNLRFNMTLRLPTMPNSPKNDLKIVASWFFSWPANSPHLDVIENLWEIIEEALEIPLQQSKAVEGFH